MSQNLARTDVTNNKIACVKCEFVAFDPKICKAE